MIDLTDFEQVAPPLEMPAGVTSITTFGVQPDDNLDHADAILLATAERALAAERGKSEALEARLEQAEAALASSKRLEPKPSALKPGVQPPSIIHPRTPSCKNDGDPLERCLP